MNSSATKPHALPALVAAVALAVTGCGQTTAKPDVDQVRADAQAQVSALRYTKQGKALGEQINRSINVDEISNLLRIAVADDQARETAYWECATSLPALVAGAWTGGGLLEWEPNPDPTEADPPGWQDYLLTLRGDQTAELEVVAQGRALSDDPVEATDTWLSTNPGKVTGWASDLDQLIAAREYRAEQPPPEDLDDLRSGKCRARFTLTMTTTIGESALDAEIVTDNSRDESWLVVRVAGDTGARRHFDPAE